MLELSAASHAVELRISELDVWVCQDGGRGAAWELFHPQPWDFKVCWGEILSQGAGVESESSRVPSHWGVLGSCFTDIVKACC